MFHRNNTSLQRISAAIVILIGYMIKILEGFFLFCKGRNPTPWNRKATRYPGGGWICSLPRDYHSRFLLRVWSEIRECSGNLTQFSSLNYLNSLVIHKIFTSSPGLWLVHDLLLFQNLSKTLLTMALILSKHGRFGHGHLVCAGHWFNPLTCHHMKTVYSCFSPVSAGFPPSHKNQFLNSDLIME